MAHTAVGSDVNSSMLFDAWKDYWFAMNRVWAVDEYMHFCVDSLPTAGSKYTARLDDSTSSIN